MRQTLSQVWSLFTPPERRKAVLMMVLIILMALTETAGVLSIMPFLSVLGRPEVIAEQPVLAALYAWSGLPDARSFIIALGIVSIIVVVLSSAFKTVTQHLINRFVHLQRHAISARLLAKYLAQPYAFFLTRNTAELNKNILSETDQLLFALIQPLAQLIAQGAVVLAMTVLVVVYDPRVALGIILAVGTLYGSIYWLVRRRLAHIGAERVLANRERFQAANEALSGIKDVKVTGSAAAYATRFNRASRLYSRHLATSDTLSQTPLYLVEAVGYCGLILIALYLLLRSGDIAQVLPSLGLYGFAAYRLLPAAQIMYRGFAKLRFSSASLLAIQQDLALPDEDLTRADSRRIEPKGGIRLEGIRFSYPSTPDRPIFNGLNLTIPANSTVAIVGRSGAGKSTLVDLLLGLMEPQAGSILVDGIPINADNVRSWQRSVAYVPQQVFLSDTTVAENIAFGIPLEQIDMESLEHAARSAQIHDVIQSLPSSYMTTLGDRGTRLSGGQRQRIAIARALYRNAKVLILDEATSALDKETGSKVMRALHNLSSDRTIIVISHDEETAGSCRYRISLDELNFKLGREKRT